MTLVLASVTRALVLLAVDRRITFDSRAPIDDATKLMRLETTDGKALLGYCGLGRTAMGTEPSAWMSRCLNGLKGPLESLLYKLGTDMASELVPHLRALPPPLRGPHKILIPCWHAARPRLYALGARHNPQAQRFEVKCVRVVDRRSLARDEPEAPQLVAVGSGSAAMSRSREWTSQLRRAIRNFRRGRIGEMQTANLWS